MLKITASPGQKVFITSDTHYGHKNICRGVTEWDLNRIGFSTTRDFKTLDEMNQAIVDGINNIVGQDDILIHLGDWSFGGFDNIRIFRDRIVCRNIHLITGNHDHHIVNNRDNIQSIFSSVHESYTQLEFKYPAGKLKGEMELYKAVLCHFPIVSWDGMNKGVPHFFGHVHLPPAKYIMGGKSMDVGVDGYELEPHLLVNCFKIMSSRIIKPTALPSDHHAVETNEK